MKGPKSTSPVRLPIFVEYGAARIVPHTAVLVRLQKTCLLLEVFNPLLQTSALLLRLLAGGRLTLQRNAHVHDLLVNRLEGTSAGTWNK